MATGVTTTGRSRTVQPDRYLPPLPRRPGLPLSLSRFLFGSRRAWPAYCDPREKVTARDPLSGRRRGRHEYEKLKITGYTLMCMQFSMCERYGKLVSDVVPIHVALTAAYSFVSEGEVR